MINSLLSIGVVCIAVFLTVCYNIGNMFGIIWHDYLYQPLFNVLIWIYNNWADQNLGWAVVYLTIILRLILLPFTLVTEKNRRGEEELVKEVRRIDKEFHNDSLLKKEEVRKILKQKKVRPWSKLVSLGVQVLVLILLYQVFLRGITGDKMMKILYSWVDFPGKINTDFYGFALGDTRDIIWPGIVAIGLLAEIYFDYRKKKFTISKADLAYFILFPAFSFIVLWMLPMVKSLFILTSILFSAIIHQFSGLIFRSVGVAEKVAKEAKKITSEVVKTVKK